MVDGAVVNYLHAISSTTESKPDSRECTQPMLKFKSYVQTLRFVHHTRA